MTIGIMGLDILLRVITVEKSVRMRWTLESTEEVQARNGNQK